MLVFVPYMQYRGAPGLFGDTLLAIRPTTSTASLAPVLRDRLREINPRVPILRINSIDAEIDRSLIEERLLAMLAGVFGVTALLITCVGLYGVMSYMAARRINEIGIRLALGASRGAISIMMLRESLWILAVGVAIGLPAALGGGQYVSSLLHGIRPSNPGVMAGATIIMLVVGLVAVMGPVRRAAELDPVVALRSD
jgi:ABC-type antimicrobial peptide transport system permease subunit